MKERQYHNLQVVSEEDVQVVAENILERKLTPEELIECEECMDCKIEQFVENAINAAVTNVFLGSS